MRKVALRGLFARKLRLALTVLAVVLGTTLIAGTYVFTDSINNAFDTIFTVSNKGTDAAITPHKTIDTSNNGGTAPTVSADVLDKVRQQPGVASAEGSVFDVGTILGNNGKRIGKGGAPNFLASVAEVPRFQAFTLKTGRRPQNANEAAIDAATADKEGWKIGDKVCAVATAPRKCYTLVGTTQIAGLNSFGGAAVLDLVLPEAQRMLGKGTGFDEIEVAGKPGVTPEQLKTQLARTLGPTVDVRTGTEQAAKESKDIRDNLGFLKTFLLAFAFIALFVGAFLIFNTFSITVAQRMREFALLRTLGASRRQILARGRQRGPAAGLRRRRGRLPARHRHAPRCCAPSSRASASTCRARASSSRRGRSSSPCSSASSSAWSPASRRRCAPCGCRRSRRCARARCRSSTAVGGAWRSSPGCCSRSASG